MKIKEEKNTEKKLFCLSKIKLIQIINSLEIRNKTLEDTIKEELYKTFMEKLSEPQELARIKRENSNLRKKNKVLKQLLKNDR